MIPMPAQGDRVTQVVLFSLDQDAWARSAACLLLLQVSETVLGYRRLLHARAYLVTAAAAVILPER